MSIETPEVSVEQNAICGDIQAWMAKPHGFEKEKFSDIHDSILFDRAVTAQLYCPKRVQLAAYSAPALAAVGASGQAIELEPRAYRYLPSKKEILAYAAELQGRIGSDVAFDIVTRDPLFCFPNGRARIGGQAPEAIGQFSSVVVYRHRPPNADARALAACSLPA
jgi:hypothetical protein